MPHLYLPTEHTDDDLVLAGQVAEAIDAAELFVVWTPAAGPGAEPRVAAVLRLPERVAPPAPPGGLRRLWRVLTRRRGPGA